MPFIGLRKFPSILFAENFCHKWRLSFIKCFFVALASVDMITWFFFFRPLTQWITLSDLFHYIPRINSAWLWCIKFFSHDAVFDLHVCSRRTLVCHFLVLPLSDLVESDTGFIKRNGKRWIFKKRLCRLDVVSSLNVWLTLPLKPSGPGVFFSERF